MKVFSHLLLIALMLQGFCSGCSKVAETKPEITNVNSSASLSEVQQKGIQVSKELDSQNQKLAALIAGEILQVILDQQTPIAEVLTEANELRESTLAARDDTLVRWCEVSLKVNGPKNSLLTIGFHQQTTATEYSNALTEAKEEFSNNQATPSEESKQKCLESLEEAVLRKLELQATLVLEALINNEQSAQQALTSRDTSRYLEEIILALADDLS